ncbi:MAG: hypothetical protein U9O97_03910 [Elusimicrobiota bacterium]|nr:hypothetical protein [Elusimicrobiota bacterium]
MKRSVLFFIVFSLTARSAYASATAAVSLSPSSTHTLIGEAFALKAVITKEAGEKVERIILPVMKNARFSVIKHTEGAKDDEVYFELRFFDLGETQVLSPEFVVSSAVIRGKPFKVFVRGRLDEAEKEIKKLRPQRRGALPLPVLFAAAAVIALAAYYLLRKKKAFAVLPEPISAEEWYRSSLGALDRNVPADELLDGLSDTFRIYIEKKCGFPALFLNTSEIEKELKDRAFGSEERMRYVSFLRSCDLAKFAAKNFAAGEIEKLFKDAYSFIGIGGAGK